MTKPRELEKDQSRPRDDLDRAADLSINDPETQPAEPPNGPSEEDDLRVVDKEEVGAGGGADEAEMARIDPLDHKPWDGNEEEPLNPAPAADEDFPAERRGPSSIEED